MEYESGCVSQTGKMTRVWITHTFSFHILDLVLLTKRRKKRNFHLHVIFFLLFYTYERHLSIPSITSERILLFLSCVLVFFLYKNKKTEEEEHNKRRKKKGELVIEQIEWINTNAYNISKNKKSFVFFFEKIINFIVSRFSFNKCSKFYQKEKTKCNFFQRKLFILDLQSIFFRSHRDQLVQSYDESKPRGIK
jgi:Ca2+/Na+ antiporter